VTRNPQDDPGIYQDPRDLSIPVSRSTRKAEQEFTLFAVVVETPAGLAAEITGINHLPQQWTGPVLVLS